MYWAGLAAMLVLGTLYSRAWSSEPLALADGRAFDVLNFNRHVSYIVELDGSRRTEHLFWVRYWANTEGTDAMRVEARQLAPALFPIAEQLGYGILKLEPADPLLLRRFPLVIWSTPLRYERDSTGTWREIAGG
jgi:hypothetical protein